MNNNEYFSSINDVSKQLDVPAHTLRYWEKQFPVAIKPTTGAGGRRYYRAETVERLMVIKDLLYHHGMTIAGVKKLLRDGNFPPKASDGVTQINSQSGPQSVPPQVGHSENASDAATRRVDVERAIALMDQALALLND